MRTPDKVKEYNHKYNKKHPEMNNIQVKKFYWKKKGYGIGYINELILKNGADMAFQLLKDNEKSKKLLAKIQQNQAQLSILTAKIFA